MCLPRIEFQGETTISACTVEWGDTANSTAGFTTPARAYSPLSFT